MAAGIAPRVCTVENTHFGGWFGVPQISTSPCTVGGVPFKSLRPDEPSSQESKTLARNVGDQVSLVMMLNCVKASSPPEFKLRGELRGNSEF